MLKTRLASVILVVGAALSLGACSGGASPSPSPSDVVQSSSPADIAAVASVAWAYDAAGNPAPTFDFPLAVNSSTARVVSDGIGEAVKAGQVVSLDYVVLAGLDGTVEYSTYTTGAPESLMLDQTQLDPELWRVLNGTHVGARIIYATLDSTATSTPYPTIVLALTVTGVTSVLDRATGTPVAPVAGLPKVTLDATGAPSVNFKGVTMPTSLVVEPLIKGSGAVVAEGQTLTVHYTGWLWNGAVFDSSWTSGSPATFTFAQGGLIDGWIQGLTGQTVGSQVLLVIPPALGYGDTAQNGIPAGSTLVFVVDILAAT